jgi:hypothetical protein
MRVSLSAVVAVAAGALACSSPETQTPVDAGPPPRGGPYLSELVVSSQAGVDASPPIALVPSFSWDVNDYYVRCAAGANPLAVFMKAASGASTSMRQPKASSSAPQQTVHLDVNENQAIVVVATAGTESTEYWVRCLPHDFPQMSMVVHTPGAPAGYYLLGNTSPTRNAMWGYAMVLDGQGVPVWYAHGAHGLGVDDVDDVVSGAISFCPREAHPFEIHHLSPVSTTYASPTNTVLNTHELRVLPNGHYMVIANPIKTGVNLTGMHTPLSDGGMDTFGRDSDILDCDIVEFDPTTGAVAWEWAASDHFDAVKDSTIPGNWDETAPDGKTVVDVFHCNSIDVEPGSDNLLVSARDMDSIFLIDRSTGKVLWKMGGTAYSKDNAKYVSVTDHFYRQHDARFQPGWSPTCAGGKGQISLFDDESYVVGPARAVVYDVVVGSADAHGGASGCSPGPGKATVAWQYEGAGKSEVEGSFRILPDGSRVIGWGQSSTPTLAFTEVDRAGVDLLDFYFTDGSLSYRVVKAPLSAFDLGVLRSTAGLP